MTTSPQVTVVDYGIGNIHSVVKALRHLGAEVTLTDSGTQIAGAQRLVLPGVGAFADGMRGLGERGLTGPVKDFAGGGRPFLGICLGMQLLMSESEEFGQHAGLDVIPGKVVAIPGAPGLKVPQIGWNRIAPRPGGTWTGTVLEPIGPGTMFYFVHSYTAAPSLEEHRLADADYGGNRISAAVQKGSVVGCQFHPEKSGPHGLDILRRFLSSN